MECSLTRCAKLPLLRVAGYFSHRSLSSSASDCSPSSLSSTQSLECLPIPWMHRTWCTAMAPPLPRRDASLTQVPAGGLVRQCELVRPPLRDHVPENGEAQQ